MNTAEWTATCPTCGKPCNTHSLTGRFEDRPGADTGYGYWHSKTLIERDGLLRPSCTNARPAEELRWVEM